RPSGRCGGRGFYLGSPWGYLLAIRSAGAEQPAILTRRREDTKRTKMENGRRASMRDPAHLQTRVAQCNFSTVLSCRSSCLRVFVFNCPRRCRAAVAELWAGDNGLHQAVETVAVLGQPVLHPEEHGVIRRLQAPSQSIGQ